MSTERKQRMDALYKFVKLKAPQQYEQICAFSSILDMDLSQRFRVEAFCMEKVAQVMNYKPEAKL